jgi:hypothetical protein
MTQGCVWRLNKRDKADTNNLTIAYDDFRIHHKTSININQFQN